MKCLQVGCVMKYICNVRFDGVIAGLFHVHSHCSLLVHWSWCTNSFAHSDKFYPIRLLSSWFHVQQQVVLSCANFLNLYDCVPLLCVAQPRTCALPARLSAPYIQPFPRVPRQAPLRRCLARCGGRCLPRKRSPTLQRREPRYLRGTG